MMPAYSIIPLDQAFDSLRAEFEQKWLHVVYLPPREFDLMAGMRSILVLGDVGSGKTALQNMLIRHVNQKATSKLWISFLDKYLTRFQ